MSNNKFGYASIFKKNDIKHVTNSKIAEKDATSEDKKKIYMKKESILKVKYHSDMVKKLIRNKADYLKLKRSESK